MTIHYYNESGEYLGIYNGEVNSSIKNCLYGTKGYGWYEGHYYSKVPVTIFNREQEKEFFNIWLTNNYEKILNTYRYSREFNEDVIMNTVLYCYSEIEKPRGINNYFNQFNWKLKKMLIDNSRKNKTLRKYEKNDIVKDNKEFIRDIASKKIEDEDYDSITDINNWIKASVITEYVLNTYGEEGKLFAKFYADKVNNKTGLRKYGEKVGISKSKLQTMFKKITDDVIENKDKVLALYELNKYKDIDDYSLNELINY